MSGEQCLRLMFKTVMMPEDIPKPDLATQFIFQQGNEVGELARQEFPGGTRIQMFPWNTILKRTNNALNMGFENIYEGAFLHDEVVVLTDILHRNDNGSFNLIEVKQSTRLKKEHIPDLAIQLHVLEGSGQTIEKCLLMHLSKDYVHEKQGDLFTFEDCTEEVKEYQNGLPNMNP